MKQAKFLIFTALFCAGSLSSAVYAAQNEWVSADYIQARLLNGSLSLDKENIVTGALEIRLSDGWHAYWRMPGEGGLPPKLDWSASENVSDVDVYWPLPERFETEGLYSFGYKESVMLPLEIKLDEQSRDTVLELDADIMVCKDICVPQEVLLSLNLPKNVVRQSSQFGPLIERAMKTVPGRENTPSLKIENIVIGPEAVVATVFSQHGYDDADLLIESGDLYIVAPPEITVDEDDPRKAMIRVAAPEQIENLANELSGQAVTLTLSSGRGAVERTIEF